MKTHHQGSTPAIQPRAGIHCDWLGTKFEIAPKANGVDAPKKQPSRQEKLDRQALEQAENEGMGAPPARKPATPKDRPTPESAWLGFRAVAQKPEL